MALIQVNLLSETLMRTVPVQVILPVDKITLPGMAPREEKPYKTLYLLHGIFGNYTDWVTGTAIARWAEEKDLAVVMPSGDNMFYIDQPDSHNYYGEFIGCELVELTRKMFPLSRQREDTFIGGLSMGGFGALRNGLKYAQTFSRIIGLSSALIADELELRTDDTPFFIESRSYAQTVFGNLSEAVHSDKNPGWLAGEVARLVGGPEGQARAADVPGELPEIYLACGREDSLLEKNIKMRDKLIDFGYKVTYEDAPGGHDWDFWNRQIKRALDWLPLGNGEEGIHSGNVRILDEHPGRNV